MQHSEPSPPSPGWEKGSPLHLNAVHATVTHGLCDCGQSAKEVSHTCAAPALHKAPKLSEVAQTALQFFQTCDSRFLLQRRTADTGWKRATSTGRAIGRWQMLQPVGSPRVTWLKEFEPQAAAICEALLPTPFEVRKSERGHLYSQQGGCDRKRWRHWSHRFSPAATTFKGSWEPQKQMMSAHVAFF